MIIFNQYIDTENPINDSPKIYVINTLFFKSEGKCPNGSKLSCSQVDLITQTTMEPNTMSPPVAGRHNNC